MRGTKRVCHACEVRFYDLLRDPIVCPSCGVQHVPAAPHMVEVGTRAAPFAGKTGWRGKGGFKRPDPEPDLAPEVAATEDGSEQAIGPTPNEDVLLEQEPDEEDVSGLVDHHVPEPKER